MAGILVKDGGLVVKDGGVFVTSAGKECCCDGAPGQFLRATRCPCDTPPPASPAYLLIEPSAIPSGSDPFVFLDGHYLVCWKVDPDGQLFDPLPGDQYVQGVYPMSSCESCCSTTCLPFAALPSSVTVKVNWTFNGVGADESPPPTSLQWTMPKLPDSGGTAKYEIAPFACHPQLPYTDDGCSMRWLATLYCASPQAPNNWRLAFTFESTGATIIAGTPDKQCVPECVPPACCVGYRFYGVAGIRPIASILGNYAITTNTPSVATVSAVVS